MRDAAIMRKASRPYRTIRREHRWSHEYSGRGRYAHQKYIYKKYWSIHIYTDAIWKFGTALIGRCYDAGQRMRPNWLAIISNGDICSSREEATCHSLSLFICARLYVVVSTLMLIIMKFVTNADSLWEYWISTRAIIAIMSLSDADYCYGEYRTMNFLDPSYFPPLAFGLLQSNASGLRWLRWRFAYISLCANTLYAVRLPMAVIFSEHILFLGIYFRLLARLPHLLLAFGIFDYAYFRSRILFTRFNFTHFHSQLLAQPAISAPPQRYHFLPSRFALFSNFIRHSLPACCYRHDGARRCRMRIWKHFGEEIASSRHDAARAKCLFHILPAPPRQRDMMLGEKFHYHLPTLYQQRSITSSTQNTAQKVLAWAHRNYCRIKMYAVRKSSFRRWYFLVGMALMLAVGHSPARRACCFSPRYRVEHTTRARSSQNLCGTTVFASLSHFLSPLSKISAATPQVKASRTYIRASLILIGLLIEWFERIISLASRAHMKKSFTPELRIYSRYFSIIYSASPWRVIATIPSIVSYRYYQYYAYRVTTYILASPPFSQRRLFMTRIDKKAKAILRVRAISIIIWSI